MRGAVWMTEPRVIDPEVTDMPGPMRPASPSVPTDAEASRAADPHGPPPPPRRPSDGPPPPPASSGSEGESRATAAAWVAAVGAALLLAAAGTFLVVSWDGLGLTARVAVVAGVTGAAILGGHRLRRVLPAVGAVVFHLGALLVPVDALGLAYQLDAGTAARWAAVGLTASLALPVLAVVGRSRVLGLAGLAGLPVLATAVGLAGLAHPAVVLAALAVVAAAVDGARPELDEDGPFGTEGALVAAHRLAAPGLATIAVMVPLAFALVARSAGSGTVLGSAAGGWVASSWVVPALVGVAAVGVLAVTATRRHSAGFAGLALASAVVSVALTVLPPATPRTVLLLSPAVIWLLAEVAALAGRDHPLWAMPTRVIAVVLEVVALIGLLGAVVVLVVLVGWFGVSVDMALAAQSLTLAAAWLVAAARRGVPGARGRGGVAVSFGTAAVVHLAAATLQFGGSVELAGLLLLAGATCSLGVLAGRTERLAMLTGSAARDVSPFAALLLLGFSGTVLSDRAALAVVLLAAPALMGAHLGAALRANAASAGPVVVSVSTLSVVLLGWLAVSLEDAGRWHTGSALLVGVVGLLWLAGTMDELEPAADSLRALAMIAGLLLLVPAWGTGALASGGGRSGLFWAYGLRVIPAATVPAAVLGVWLVIDALRRRRMVIATLATPVVVRALASGLLASGVSIRLTGALLLGVAVSTACAAAIGPRALLGPMATGSVFAGLVGWVFVGDTPTLRAALVVAAGLGIAAAGAFRRRPLVAHLGGVLATIGVWQLLDIGQHTALDLWLLPVALQLTVAGESARRRGTSSWVAFVPPLLLVAIPAIAERITGGGGWHAVLAGGVGVVAIVTGGARRLGGPLIVGTMVTVAVALVETFAVVAAVPTWLWLAVGGLVLLGAAALIERMGGSPVTAVRRAVDVVGERFE
jgi:hypothetical protein